jgi:hypothetical protein
MGAKRVTRACANNTPAWARFGLNAPRGLNFGLHDQAVGIRPSAESSIAGPGRGGPNSSAAYDLNWSGTAA